MILFRIDIRFFFLVVMLEQEKTITAECIANRLTTETQKNGFLLKLSTRVRGKGLHGEMSQLIQNAFENLTTQAGKKRLAFLLIDEADSIASLRSTEQNASRGKGRCQYTNTKN